MELFVSNFVNKIDKKGRVSLPSIFRSALPKHHSNEIILLKSVWDMVAIINALFEKWSSTLWLDIDTDMLMDETVLLDKQVSGMTREMRNWDVYKTLYARVKNMAVVIPLISELHSEAMQERHWKTLKNKWPSSQPVSSLICILCS